MENFSTWGILGDIPARERGGEEVFGGGKRRKRKRKGKEREKRKEKKGKKRKGKKSSEGYIL